MHGGEKKAGALPLGLLGSLNEAAKKRLDAKAGEKREPPRSYAIW